MEASKEKAKETEEIEISSGGKRKIAVPGEVIASGTNYLPGEGSKREDKNIIATRYGIVQEEGRLVRIIPLSGVYIPRRGNIVIGEVTDIMFNGWQIEIKSPYTAFLPVSECRGFINKKEDLSSYFDFGDIIVAKIWSIKPRGIDLTMRDRGLSKLHGGILMTVNANKVPRVIGKKGSMIGVIKDGTGCDVIVGQNGIIWIKGDTVEQELLVKSTINFIVSKSFIEGLTEKVEEFIKEHSKGMKIPKREYREEQNYEEGGREERGEERNEESHESREEF